MDVKNELQKGDSKHSGNAKKKHSGKEIWAPNCIYFILFQQMKYIGKTDYKQLICETSF